MRFNLCLPIAFAFLLTNGKHIKAASGKTAGPGNTPVSIKDDQLDGLLNPGRLVETKWPAKAFPAIL